MKVCVVGGGNLGHFLTALLSKNGADVSLLTSRPSEWNSEITVHNTLDGSTFTGHLSSVSENGADVLSDADVILITVPSNALPETIKKHGAFFPSCSMVGIIPGTGGAEFVCSELVDKGCILFGSQRVPASTKTTHYGNTVDFLGKRKNLKLAALNKNDTENVCKIMGNLLEMECIPLPNYLSVTLTPSNPILHTARLYSLFKNYKKGTIYSEQYKFYKNWSDDSSQMLLGCNHELQQLCKSLTEIDLSHITDLRMHYEIDSMPYETETEKMTHKMSTLPFLKDSAPMTDVDGGYIPNLSSRYFSEDFSYGLCIIKDFCGICGITTPFIDEILKWYEKLFDLRFYDQDSFSGEDLIDLPLPSHHGIKTKGDIYKFYQG
jgi:hypothetical protein